jgi:hypothetical protein
MAELITVVATFCVFLAIYELLRRRSARHGGTKPVVQWVWLAAIVGCAAFAVAMGIVLGSYT